ncbi:MAG: response regulator [Ideonella sp.]|nr:response regulator [Ideonella sp.]MCC7457314.1 response regulator [Nitrospira sp.]
MVDHDLASVQREKVGTAPQDAGAFDADALSALERPIDELIEHERIKSLYRMAPHQLVAGLAYGPLFTWAMTYAAPFAAAYWWLAARTAFGLLRLWHVRRFLRADPGPGQIGRWHRTGLVLLALDAASWAALAPVFLGGRTGLEQALVLATQIGVTAIGSMTLMTSARAVSIFAVSMLLPLMVMLPAGGDAAGLICGIGSGLYLVLVLFEARRTERRWSELQRLRFETARHAQQARGLQRLAEQASEAKSRFLATVSHELRTPLNGILGMTQLALAELRDSKSRERLQTILGSAQHLRRLIGDLVDLARIEAGKLDLMPVPFCAITLMHDVTQLLQPAAVGKALTLRVQPSGSLPKQVFADAARVRQVLHNLVGNAVKFSTAGTVSVAADWAAPVLRFVVRDNGPGVPAAQRATIFDAFDQGARDADGGLGLGLTISRQLARAMGGDVVLLDEPGPGAAFAFTLRTDPDARVDRIDLTHSLALPTLSAHALLVDDNAVNAEVARAMLEHLGLAVTTASDGEQALALQRSRAFDLVLMDCEMPVLDGLGATRRWREQEARDGHTTHVPIVALTASAVQGDRERCLAAGMDDYIAKPFDLSELAAVLVRVLPPR